MAENNDLFFTPNHIRLERISRIANFFAWIVVIFFVLQLISQILSLINQQGFNYVMDRFKEYPLSAINFFLSTINILFKGTVYWLTLKGVSLGLKMIVETDLNYRDKLQGESNE